MTKAAEGFAAECIAEVGVGMAAVTSGAAFVKEHVRVKVCGKLIRWVVDLRNETTIYRFAALSPLFLAKRKTQRLSLVSVFRILEIEAACLVDNE
jgi:hypothetical protein